MLSNKFYQQTNRAVQGHHLSCPYFDNAMTMNDEIAVYHPFKSLIWMCFHNDVIPLWIHSFEYQKNLIAISNSTDVLGKIKLTM